MGRKNGNATRGGNAPHRTGSAGQSMREAWVRIVNAVHGSPFEGTADAAAFRADDSGYPRGSEAWSRVAHDTYRALTT